MPPRPISVAVDRRTTEAPSPKPKPKLKHSKSEADMHGPKQHDDEMSALTEKIDVVDSSREKQISDDVNDTEEQYLATEYMEEIKATPSHV